MLKKEIEFVDIANINSNIQKPQPTTSTTNDVNVKVNSDNSGTLTCKSAPSAVSPRGTEDTILRAATEGNVKEVMNSLLNAGTRYISDSLGNTALHLAAKNNHREIVQILLRFGSFVNSSTKVSRTPLHMAACEGHVAIVQVLLNNGANQNCLDMLQMTPLHWAVQNAHIECVAALLETKKQKFVRNKFGLLPIDIARQIKREDILQLLVNYGSQASGGKGGLPVVPKSLLKAPDQQDLAVSKEAMFSETENKDGEEESMELGEVEEAPKLTVSKLWLVPVDKSAAISSSAVERGHSMALTDVGKNVYDSVKTQQPQPSGDVKTATAEEVPVKKADIYKVARLLGPQPKKKLVPVPKVQPAATAGGAPDLDPVMSELAVLRNIADYYKAVALKQEQEIQKLKLELLLCKN